MKMLRADEVAQLSGLSPATDPGLDVNWLEGPANGEPLDTGLVTLLPGAVIPPHVHQAGQFIYVLSGRGFVETATDRVLIGPGDVVLTPPGELHTHGAAEDSPMAHLAVTTGRVSLPEADPAADDAPAATD